MDAPFDRVSPAAVGGSINPTRRQMEARLGPIRDGSARRRFADANAGDPALNGLNALARGMLDTGVTSLAPLLPLLLTIRGQPYTIDNRPMYGMLYNTVEVPPELCLVTGRQTGKSMGLASMMISRAVAIPNFQNLYVAPLHEQTRRFSNNYVGKLLNDSPVRDLILPPSGAMGVLQKDYANGSIHHFSYAQKDAERSRGLPIDCCDFDEVQNSEFDVISLVKQTMRASPWRLARYIGTPKTFDNSIYELWSNSSQAEWMIKCPHGGCGYWNCPRRDNDLLDMIGPWRADISPKAPGLVCAKCRKPVSPRPPFGRWVHAYPNRRLLFPGYHVSQTIIPDTCEDPDAWSMLLSDFTGASGQSFTAFLNEVCGETYEEGTKLVTLEQLKAASCLDWHNRREQAIKAIRRYTKRVLAIDWGGGGGIVGQVEQDGKQRPRTSWTVYAVLGLNDNGGVDVIYGHRSRIPHDPLEEAKVGAALAKMFRVQLVVHDMANGGDKQEVFMRQAGWAGPMAPTRYVAPTTRHLIQHHKPDAGTPRDWYAIAKAASLAFTCECIKAGYIRFPKDDFDDKLKPAVAKDFLGLVEEQIEPLLTSPIHVIRRIPSRSDDFAQAVNIGSHALWFSVKAWPNVAVPSNHELTDEQLRNLSREIDWSLLA